MEQLEKLFIAMKFTNVSTYIASGNVIFEAGSTDSVEIEKVIEDRLELALGYEVATLVRTPRELAAIVVDCPFPSDQAEEAGHRIHVGFLRNAPSSESARKLASLCGPMDEFKLIGRELFWLCRGKTTDSLVGWPVVAKSVGVDSTMRNVTTIQKLSSLHPAT
jgi:uncharacterized protein (DUF1697 family)